jgi:hypothetical protein
MELSIGTSLIGILMIIVGILTIFVGVMLHAISRVLVKIQK